MTSHEPTRSFAHEAYRLRTAAAAEAVAAGHPEVDVDHLLVALVVAGGPAAGALRGADAEALRGSADELAAQDLLALGVTAGGGRARPHGADWRGATSLPVNSRARDLLGSVERGDDRDLLRALVHDEGRRARRLLGRAGVDPDDLLRRLELDPPSGPGPHDHASADGADLLALAGAPPQGAVWTGASWSQTAPAPVERVWALVDDASRRAGWDPTCTAVTPTGQGRATVTGQSGRTATETVVRRERGHAIAWRRRDDATPAAAGDQLVAITLSPDGDATRVRLERAWPARGLGVRLARPLLVATVRAQLRVQAQGIARAA